VHCRTWDCTFATLGPVTKYTFTITDKDIQVKSNNQISKPLGLFDKLDIRESVNETKH
jgi:hypothetical protein